MGKRLIDLLILLVLAATAVVVLGMVVLPNLSDDEDAESGAALAATPTPLPAVVLDPLTDEQLRSLLPSADEVSALVGAPVTPEDYVEPVDNSIDPEIYAEWPAFGEQLDYLVGAYDDYPDIGSRYDLCQQIDLPLASINVHVEQYPDHTEPRQLIDDPAARGLMTAMMFDLTETSTVHGWELFREESDGECYPEEDEYELMFEHWGLVFYIDIAAEAGSDPVPIRAIIDALVPPIFQRIDALAPAATLPPTPIPPAGPSVTHDVDLADVERGLPPSDWIEEDSPWRLDPSVSRTYTLDEYVAAFENLGLDEVANALAQAGAQNGMVGQVVRIWNTGTQCPQIMGLAIEMDLALFGSAAGARSFMQDPTLQQAWRNTGLVDAYTPDGSDSVVMRGRYPNHRCGPMKVIERKYTYDRLLVTLSLTGYEGIPDEELLELVDGFIDAVDITIGLVGVPAPE